MGPPARRQPLPLKALNHVSRCCVDVARSFAFYTDVLGFIPVKRPASFEFEGAWMFNYGIGLHLVKGNPVPRDSKIEPKSCHISFQVSISLEEMEAHLKEWDLPYVKQVFVEDGVQVGQLFFHDPDNNMIGGWAGGTQRAGRAVCNCHDLPVVPLTEGLLACAKVAAINTSAAAVAVAAVEQAALPADAVSSLAAALLADVPALIVAPPAAAAAAAAAATEEDLEHGASSSVRRVTTAPAADESPDPAASPKMPVTPPSCDAAATAAEAAAAPPAAIASIAMSTAPPLPPRPPSALLSTPCSQLLADEAASSCSGSLDCELHEQCCVDDASSAACGSVAGGPRRSHSFGNSSMFSGFSGSLASASMSSGLLGTTMREAAAAGSVCASELDQWLSLLGTAASEPAPAAKGAGAPSYAYLASPAGSEMAPPPGLSGLSCAELGACPAAASYGAAAAERKQAAACEQASQLQQQHIYAQYLRQRLAVVTAAAACACAGGPKGGSGAVEVGGDPRRQKMQEHAAMVGMIGALGGPSVAVVTTPAAGL
ncbi:hypothetical protein HXX76_007767 [Chlamydomonas incerta]|uniref:VOC domain-containing protein n=1 Tax=Chlamydomonas incerta TaxID=51695 RepID=A0A835W1Z1_CHLIN|nr:hypothetical protein HXX76_007767 [Chlamydomonas incerta]|eukprot:KAG2434039.1 hypothetical protein HXX76_007767 [Chlamydomonas incerta]